MKEKKDIRIPYNLGYISALDPTFLPDGAVSDIEAVQVYKLWVERMSGIAPSLSTEVTKESFLPFFGNVLFADSQQSVPLSTISDPIKIGHFITEDGDKEFFLVSRNAIHQYNNGDWTYLTSFTGHPDHRVSYVYFNGEVYIVSTYDVAKVLDWKLKTLTTHPTLENIKARTNLIFYSHLLLGHTIESDVVNPLRIRWSDTGNYKDFSSGNASFFDLVETDDHVVSLRLLLDRCILYKASSIWEITYVGYPTMFTYSPIITNIGCEAPDTIVNYSGTHIFLGTDNVYIFNGRELLPIGDNIKEDLFGKDSILNRSMIHRCTATAIEHYNEYWLAVPTSGAYNPNVLYVFNFKTKEWTKRSLDPALCMDYAFENLALMWQDAKGIWLQSLNTWEDIVEAERLQTLTISGTVYPGSTVYFDTKQTPTVFIGQTGQVVKAVWDNKLVQGKYPTAYVVTKNLTTDEKGRWVEFQAEVAEGGIELFYSIDEGNTWTSLGVKSNTSSQFKYLNWYMNVTTEDMMFKLVWTDSEAKVKNLKALVALRKGSR